jgi:hypothetical protein
LRRSRIESKFDCINIATDGCELFIEDCDLIAIGPTPAGSWADARCIVTQGTGAAYVKRTRCYASGSTNGNYGIVTNGTAHFSEVIFNVSGTGATDVAQTAGTAIDYGRNNGSGTGGALVTSGTITNRKGHSGIDMATIKPSRLIVVDSATFTPTTTAFETEQTTDESAFYTEQVLYALDGANAGMTVRVTAYAFTNSKVKLTVDALKVAPADGDRFTMYGRIEQ